MRIQTFLKRLTVVTLFLAMLFSFTASAATGNADGEARQTPLPSTEEDDTPANDWTFEHGITIVCPWGEGGGADSTLRPMCSLLEEYLGVPVTVRNETGESGVVGATYAYQQSADGYTFLLGTQSLFIQDLMGKMSFDFKDAFQCETMLVHSINLLAASRVQMEKYGIETFSDLQAYVASHPNQVSVAMQSAVGVDGMCLELATEGLALNQVEYESGTDVNTDLALGKVDMAVGGYDDMSSQIYSGKVVPLLLFSERHIPILPECECTAELSIDSYAGPWRAIFAKKGTPQGAIDAIVEAVEVCRKDATWKGFVMNAGYDQRTIPSPGEETQTFCQTEYQDIRNYLLSRNSLVKDYDDLK